MKVVLKEDAEKLDEVVVIGYGAVRKADVAGAVAVLDNKSFKDQPITQVSDALQGRVSGVQVENSGVPGGSVKIRVRGSGSINKSNDPLYVVDGIVRESGLDGINPEDIQSMQVLKDASSTAIYGSRGSNGVVLVTTKTGKAGASQITLDASFGVANVYERYDLLNTREYAQALVDAGKKARTKCRLIWMVPIRESIGRMRFSVRVLHKTIKCHYPVEMRKRSIICLVTI